MIELQKPGVSGNAKAIYNYNLYVLFKFLFVSDMSSVNFSLTSQDTSTGVINAGTFNNGPYNLTTPAGVSVFKTDLQLFLDLVTIGYATWPIGSITVTYAIGPDPTYSKEVFINASSDPLIGATMPAPYYPALSLWPNGNPQDFRTAFVVPQP